MLSTVLDCLCARLLFALLLSLNTSDDSSPSSSKAGSIEVAGVAAFLRFAFGVEEEDGIGVDERVDDDDDDSTGVDDNDDDDGTGVDDDADGIIVNVVTVVLG